MTKYLRYKLRQNMPKNCQQIRAFYSYNLYPVAALI